MKYLKSLITPLIIIITSSCNKKDIELIPVPENFRVLIASRFTLADMDSIDRNYRYSQELCDDKNGLLGNFADGHIVFNDSITIAYGNSLINNAIYSKWQTTAIPGYKIVNRALGGSRYEQFIPLMKYIVYPKTKNAIFYGGENELELTRTMKQKVDSAKRAILTFRGLVPHARVLVLSQQLCPVYVPKRALIEEFNDSLKNWVATQQNMLWVDVFHATLNASGNTRPELFKTDGKHFIENGVGYAIWDTILKKHLDSNLVTAPPPPPVGSPIAIAGNDATYNLSLVQSGYQPVLNATPSNDPGGWITKFLWSQISGPTVTLMPYTIGKVKLTGFTIKTTYAFRVTVTDNIGLTATDDVIITIN